MLLYWPPITFLMLKRFRDVCNSFHFLSWLDYFFLSLFIRNLFAMMFSHYIIFDLLFNHYYFNHYHVYFLIVNSFFFHILITSNFFSLFFCHFLTHHFQHFFLFFQTYFSNTFFPSFPPPHSSNTPPHSFHLTHHTSPQGLASVQTGIWGIHLGSCIVGT